jgi:4-amino-4-deoxy-L-arabinose transferase-like glycosyltransferase
MSTLTTGNSVSAQPAAAADGGEPRRWLPRVALAALLIGTAVLYLWNLSKSGWANAFYSAAAQAGSQSWKAFLFGSSDAANSITVDKPPMSLWPMALSVRVFGLSSWSILVPQALLGVASVALMWDTVRRWFGEYAGLIAGLLLALTPVAAVIFRYNNPDALLLLLMIGAVWAVLRAVDDGRTRWLLLCGALVGCGYLTKQLQIALIMPALASTYLLAGPPRLLRRVYQLVAALGVAVVVGGWWVAVVQLWPRADRPWIGGSQHNSVLELTFGYNGLGRLTGDEPGSVGPNRFGHEGTPAGFMRTVWGVPGLNRLWQPLQVGQIGWLLGAALVFLGVLLVWRRRAPRTDVQRASVLVWGLWLLVNGLVFSYMRGIFHPYYTVALAPPIAALTAIGVVVGWQHRCDLWAQATMAAAAAATVATTFLVLRHNGDYYPWLRWVEVIAVAIVMIWALFVGAAWTERVPARVAVVLAAAVLALGGPAVYTLTTLERGNTGALPTAGPPMQFGQARPLGAGPHGGPASNGRAPWTAGGRGGCNLLDAGKPEPAVVDKLNKEADSYTWVAATIGSSCASGYQLATGHPVMSVGGFNGSDPSPPQPDFERMVVAGKIHYFIVVGSNDDLSEKDPAERLNNSGLIQQWVEQNFAPLRVSGATIYDLTA